MRIHYTYQNYPNCPRATEYSRSAESAAAYGGIFIGPITIGAVIAFLICTFSFFGKYNWGEFLGAIAFAVLVAIVDFYYFVIRLNNTQCEIKAILAEESNRNLPSAVVQQFCENLRTENRKENKNAFMRFFSIFLVSLFDAVALIAAIKGIYFLCHREGGLFLLLGAVVTMAILSYIIWWLIGGHSLKSNETILTTNNDSTSSTHNSSKCDDIAFCRKCGTKVFSDSVFCAKCGTKIR